MPWSGTFWNWRVLDPPWNDGRRSDFTNVLHDFRRLISQWFFSLMTMYAKVIPKALQHEGPHTPQIACSWRPMSLSTRRSSVCSLHWLRFLLTSLHPSMLHLLLALLLPLQLRGETSKQIALCTLLGISIFDEQRKRCYVLVSVWIVWYVIYGSFFEGSFLI